MKQRGVTLIELVVAIVVVAIAIASVLGVISRSAVNSSNRMIQQQASAIASAYLEEIMQKPFTDPNGGVEAARSAFDDIFDYNGRIDNGARDQLDTPIAGLNQYTVSVQLLPGTLPGVPGAAVRLIRVTVTHASGITVVADGYKTSHPMP
jgi:MSHA pilin protein MshD